MAPMQYVTLCRRKVPRIFPRRMVYRIAGNFEDENVHEFRGFVRISKIFNREIQGVWSGVALELLGVHLNVSLANDS